MDNSSLIPLLYSNTQGLKLLTLRWQSFLGHGDEVFASILPRKADASSIMDESSVIVPWSSTMEGLESMTLSWRSFLGNSDTVVKHIFA